MPLPVGPVLSRSLYLYENIALQAIEIEARSLYAYENYAVQPIEVEARMLYLFENVAIEALTVLVRTLYLYEAWTNGEIFPWIERIRPPEQYEGGQVEIYGDGFGATEAAEGGMARLGVYDPAIAGPGVVMGVVAWSTRSPNLWPANGDGSGAPPPRSLPALVVTVPVGAASGMLSVEETT